MSYFSRRIILTYLSTFALLVGLVQVSFPNPVLAGDCSWSSRPDFTPTDLKNKMTVTVEQIAFDLCYVAGQLSQRKQSANGWTSQSTKKQVMNQMEEIVAETNFLSICATQGTDAADQTDPDHAVPDHVYKEKHVKGFGCGPYYQYDTEPDVNRQAKLVQIGCDGQRPWPYGENSAAGRHPARYEENKATGHPPTTLLLTAFDLCRASTNIATKRLGAMSPAELDAYMINLMLEVNLALNCAKGRAHDINGKFSIPSPTRVDYIATREFGCSPKTI